MANNTENSALQESPARPLAARKVTTITLDTRNYFEALEEAVEAAAAEFEFGNHPAFRQMMKFNREMAAPDRDARIMRLARQTALDLRHDARQHEIDLDGDTWVPPESLAPHTGRLTQLFNSLTVSPIYKSWEEDRTDELVRTLCLDDHFRTMAREWHLAPPPLLMNYVADISRTHQKIFSRDIVDTPPQISVDHFCTGRESAAHDRLVLGSHRRPGVHHEPHQLEFNIHADARFHHVAQGLNVTFHENLHASQWMLAAQYAAGEIPRTDPLHRDARLLFLAFEERASYVPGIKSVYRAHPTEEDTFRATDAFIAKLGKGLARYGIDLAPKEKPVALLPHYPANQP
ncbi:MAG: hypothetical protein KJ667_08120 [Alphaproteobacteria bacterium]|nr:hypothetical protein [Alphaproteobacteria bacterium]